MDIKVIKEAASMIPGFPKVRLREATYQPGGPSKNTMQNPMVYECSQGSFAPLLSAEGPVREDVDYM
jgi:hypothetical protein